MMELFLSLSGFFSKVIIYIHPMLAVSYFLSALLTDKCSKKTLFIWLFSMPLTISFFLAGVGKWLPFPSVVNAFLVYGLLFAQLGWVGGLCSLIAMYWKLSKLKSIAFWISILSVLGNGFFFFLALSGTNS